MRKAILTIASSALIATSAVQIASAAQAHRSHRPERAPVSTSQQLRNANAHAPLPQEPDWSRYNGGLSAPAGR